jgi:hypothetical protein
MKSQDNKANLLIAILASLSNTNEFSCDIRSSEKVHLDGSVVIRFSCVKKNVVSIFTGRDRNPFF